MDVVRLAHVADGVVTNVSLHPAGAQVPEGCVVIPMGDLASPGWRFDRERFEPPQPAQRTPSPEERQADLFEALAQEWEDTAAALSAGKVEEAGAALERAARAARDAAAALREG